MRKQKAFLVVSLVLLLLGMGAWGCNQPCPTCGPTCEACRPTPTPIDTSALETQVAALETALAECEGTSCVPRAEVCDNGEDDDCDGLVDTADPDCPNCLDAISCEEAKANIGEIGTVRGKIVDTDYASGSSGQPTFLNLCCSYPEPCRFTALIWGEDRQEFIDCLDGPPEQVLLNREVCVEGLIEIYEGIPEIILTQCDQLTIIQ